MLDFDQENTNYNNNYMKWSLYMYFIIITLFLRAAAENDKESLKAWLLAGVDISTPDYSGNTAIQVVSVEKLLVNEIIMYYF